MIVARKWRPSSSLALVLLVASSLVAGQQQQQQQQDNPLANLGAYMEKAKALGTLLGPLGQQPAPANVGQPQLFGQQLSQALQQQTGAPQAPPTPGAQLMGQLNSLGALFKAGQQQASEAQAAGQQQAGQAQAGFQSAFSELGQGLQRIVSNNPNLVPDLKTLYSSVSSRFPAGAPAGAPAASPPAIPATL